MGGCFSSKSAKSGGYDSIAYQQSAYGAPATPIDGNIYFWFAHFGPRKAQRRYLAVSDDSSSTRYGQNDGNSAYSSPGYGQGETRAGYTRGAVRYEAYTKAPPTMPNMGRLVIAYMFIAALQLFGPIFIVYHQVIKWPFEFGFGFMFPDEKGDPEEYTDMVLAKLFSMLCFYLFLDKLAQMLDQKATAATKMAALGNLQGDTPRGAFLANMIIPVANILTAVATYITLLEAPDVITVVSSVTGLLLLAQLDEMGGIDLSPLGPEQWDPQAQGDNYTNLLSSADPSVDPDDLTQPYFDPYRANCLKYAATFLRVVQLFATISFFFMKVKEA